MSDALELTRLRLRLLDAIENDKRAKRGSDKTYRRECRQELENTRNAITKIFAKE